MEYIDWGVIGLLSLLVGGGLLMTMGSALGASLGTGNREPTEQGRKVHSTWLPWGGTFCGITRVVVRGMSPHGSGTISWPDYRCPACMRAGMHRVIGLVGAGLVMILSGLVLMPMPPVTREAPIYWCAGVGPGPAGMLHGTCYWAAPDGPEVEP